MEYLEENLDEWLGEELAASLPKLPAIINSSQKTDTCLFSVNSQSSQGQSYYSCVSVLRLAGNLPSFYCD
jgi:hypothetical protein